MKSLRDRIADEQHAADVAEARLLEAERILMIQQREAGFAQAVATAVAALPPDASYATVNAVTWQAIAHARGHSVTAAVKHLELMHVHHEELITKHNELVLEERNARIDPTPGG
jgi:hypothetical protein